MNGQTNSRSELGVCARRRSIEGVDHLATLDKKPDRTAVEVNGVESRREIQRQVLDKIGDGTARWEELPHFITPAETAALLRISRTACYESLRTGLLRSVSIRWGRKILISTAALQTTIARAERLS